MLVIIGEDEWGNKDVPGLTCGFRESTQSWCELLLYLKHRGLQAAPKLAVRPLSADCFAIACRATVGAMGFRAALHEVYGKTRAQRCWVHKTANVLNALPKSVQPKAKAHLKYICLLGHACLPGNRWPKPKPKRTPPSISSSRLMV